MILGECTKPAAGMSTKVNGAGVRALSTVDSDHAGTDLVDPVEREDLRLVAADSESPASSDGAGRGW